MNGKMSWMLSLETVLLGTQESRTNVKMDGFESFSNITLIVWSLWYLKPKCINMFFTCHFDFCKYIVSCSIYSSYAGNGPGVNKNFLLSTDPWWSPIFISNSWLKPLPTRTRLSALAYIPWTNRKIHSSTPNFLRAHQITVRVTQSNAVSRSTKAI